MTLYADVILPLPLYSTYTYEVPAPLQHDTNIGCRVLVPFGKSACYTAIVSATHSNPPSPGIETREIISILDSEPILRHPQLKLWQWLSQYYLCSPGEVMKAALPAALKVESESWLKPAPDPDPTDVEALKPQQATLLAHITQAKKIRISELEKKLNIPSLRLHLNQLIEQGLVVVAENIVDKYISQKATYVSLTLKQGDSAALDSLLDSLKRSHAQERLLIAYLELSLWHVPGQSLKPVERKQLLGRSGVSSSILATMLNKGIFRQQTVRINRFSATGGNTPATTLPQLTEAQTQALDGIHAAMETHLVTLLRGVTGSGKTEIYAHLMHETLARQRHVLMLVPEISLTTQLTDRLRRIFGDRLLVYHSKFSDSERVDIWRRLLKSDSPLIVLGVRSSVFLPFPDIGLIVVDEEHEASYKQYDPAPRYNARDTAIMLATMHSAKVLLGSATPAIDTYYKATNGKYGLVELLTRYSDATLPVVQVVDMRDRRTRKQVSGPFATDMIVATRAAMQAGKQAIIFQNRRGYAPVVVCAQCGWTPKCPHCDISLVYHQRAGMLQCHYCGYNTPLPALCPACGTNSLSTLGYGTERLAESMHTLIPDATIARMDLDTTRAKDAYQNIIENFSKGNTRILIGTQMVSKGLDFKNVTLVGIVNADTLINFPDFRSNERAFCTLEQVSGRAGRHSDPGTVLIQTTNPVHPVIRAVQQHDYTGFYACELQQRQNFTYPPYSKIINIYLRHKDENTLQALTQSYATTLRQYFGSRLLGPDTPSVSRIAGWHIRVLMLKIEPAASMPKVKNLLRRIYAASASLPGMKTLRIHYDVDPA